MRPDSPLAALMPDLTPRIAARLRSLRSAKGISSQQALADAIAPWLPKPISGNKVGTWEREEAVPDAIEVAALATLYGCSTEFILCRTDSTTGLDPDSFLVDLDLIDDFDSDDVWWVKVPRNHRIVDYREFERMRAQRVGRGRGGA